MSKKHQIRKPEAKKKIQVSAALASAVVIRLVAASIVFAVSLILDIPEFLGIILLVLSAVIAGYDILMNAVASVENGDFTADPVIIVLAAVIAYFVGFSIEGAALILLYQIGVLLLGYAKDKARKSALELMSYQDDDAVKHMEQIIGDESRLRMPISDVLGGSSGRVLKIAMVFAILYAVLVPLFTSLSFTVSIHRALIILVAAAPATVAVSMNTAAAVGMCYNAQQGIFYNNAASMESLAGSDTVVFDKNGVFTADSPRVLAVYSDVLDSKTFMNFVAHSVYYSEQPFAQAITESFDQSYKLDVIKDFRDIPGYGVELSIDGIGVLFATSELLKSRGIEVPDDSNAIGQTYYMSVAGRLMGRVIVSTEVNEADEELLHEMKNAGFTRFALLTEESKDAAVQFAESMDFNELYSECDKAKKLETVREISRSAAGFVTFIHAFRTEAHSAAAIEMRIGNNDEHCDAALTHDAISNIPFAKGVSVRVREICRENALFVFVAKALIIALSIIGYCNLWLAIIINYAAAVVSVLNTIRVTGESLKATLKYKTGH